MALPILAIGQVMVGGVTNYFIRKLAKAKSQEFIDKVLDTVLEYAGPALISALRRKAEATKKRKWDDAIVDALEDILGLKEQ